MTVMKSPEINYTIKIATENDIFLYLKECNNDFEPPLSNKVSLDEYSRKLFEKSVTFEAWHKNKLVSLIAAYFNDDQKLTGFITSVSVIKEYKGKGIVSHLMLDCIYYAIKINFSTILLEVNKTSIKAINLYKKFGFIDMEDKDNTLIMMLDINKINHQFKNSPDIII
jgi:ribosomal protein S18 acetylase RimI-like enzyme